MILAGYSPKKTKLKLGKQSKGGSILEQKSLVRGSKTTRSNQKSNPLDASSVQKQMEVQSISSLLKNFGKTTKNGKHSLNSASNSMKNLQSKSTKSSQNPKPVEVDTQPSLS